MYLEIRIKRFWSLPQYLLNKLEIHLFTLCLCTKETDRQINQFLSFDFLIMSLILLLSQVLMLVFDTSYLLCCCSFLNGSFSKNTSNFNL